MQNPSGGWSGYAPSLVQIKQIYAKSEGGWSGYAPYLPTFITVFISVIILDILLVAIV